MRKLESINFEEDVTSHLFSNSNPINDFTEVAPQQTSRHVLRFGRSVESRCYVLPWLLIFTYNFLFMFLLSHFQNSKLCR